MADTTITSVVNTPSSEIANKTFVAATYTSKSDLASTASSKGASLVGVQDSGSSFGNDTVEGCLAELMSKFGDYVTYERWVTIIVEDTPFLVPAYALPEG